MAMLKTNVGEQVVSMSQSILPRTSQEAIDVSMGQDGVAEG